MKAATLRDCLVVFYRYFTAFEISCPQSHAHYIVRK
jgi:hypothetical protein